jgi:hypothetical protein
MNHRGPQAIHTTTDFEQVHLSQSVLVQTRTEKRPYDGVVAHHGGLEPTVSARGGGRRPRRL